VGHGHEGKDYDHYQADDAYPAFKEDGPALSQTPQGQAHLGGADLSCRQYCRSILRLRGIHAG